MAGNAIAGNGNFDIDAIRAAVAAMEQSSPASGLNGDQSPGEFAEKMRRTFDSVNEIEASFVANEALRANDQDNVGFIESGEKSEKEKKDREALAAYQDMIDAEAESREAETARREAYWADRDVEFDGMTMKGREWKSAANLMRSEEFRRRMREQGLAKGYTPQQIDEAERLAPAMADRLAAGQKPTTEQQNAYQSNPALKDYIQAAQQQTLETKLSSVQKNDSEITTAQIGQHSVVAGSNILDDAASMSPAANAPATITTPLSVAVTRDEQLNNATPDLKTGFNAAANAQPSDATLQRTAEIQLAAARAPAPDQAIGI